MDDSCPSKPDIDVTIQRNSLNEHRKYTDVIYIVVLGFMFVTWVVLCFFASNAEQEKPDEIPMELQPRYKLESILLTTLGLIFALIFMYGFIKIMQYRPKILAWIGLICTPLVPCRVLIDKIITGYPFRHLPILLHHVAHTIPTIEIISIFFYAIEIIFFVAAVCCVKKTRLTVIVDILRRTASAFFSLSHLILFGLIISAIEINLYLTLNNFSFLGLHSVKHYLALSVVTYLFFFIYYYAKIIMSTTIGTWYRAQDKSNIPKLSIFKHIVTMTRYHIGTVAFAALPILPSCVGSFVAFKQRIDRKRSIVNLIIDFILFVYLSFNITDYSLILTSMHGKNFYQSTKTAYRLLTKGNIFFLGFIYVFHAMLLVAILIIALTTVVPSLVWQDYRYNNGISLYFTPEGCFSMIMLMSVLLLFDACGQVHLLCSLEDQEDADTTQNHVSLNAIN